MNGPYLPNQTGRLGSSVQKGGKLAWQEPSGGTHGLVISAGLIDAQSVRLQMERSLNPNKFHYRAPFSKEISHDSIQLELRRRSWTEIAYAKFAGIDYWAFVGTPAQWVGYSQTIISPANTGTM
jgi:hypothetical protein